MTYDDFLAGLESLPKTYLINSYGNSHHAVYGNVRIWYHRGQAWIMRGQDLWNYTDFPSLLVKANEWA